jgi:hypothetical protein
MNPTTPPCRTVTVVAFRGSRSPSFAATIRRALDAEKNGVGPGPTILDCMLYLGHAGVSTDGGKTIYGFKPDCTGIAVWQLIDRLKNGDALPADVQDDSSIFAAAQLRGFAPVSIDLILPDPQFESFCRSLDANRGNSQYAYGFPNGDGDCNCITWLERLGLPLLTGRMHEFIGLPAIKSIPTRRFGRCV